MKVQDNANNKLLVSSAKLSYSQLPVNGNDHWLENQGKIKNPC